MRLVFSVLPVEIPTRLTGSLTLGALLAGLGACSNFDSLRSPVFTGSTNQQQIIAGTGQTPLGGTYVGTGSAAGVYGGDLPPPPGAPAPTAYAAAPQPYTPPLAAEQDGAPVPLHHRQ